MAASVSASRTLVQAIKPHIPKISFPKKGARAGQTGAAAGSRQTPQKVSVTPGTSPTSSSQQKPPGPSQRGTGVNDTELPARYRRKPIDQSEMDEIMRGGRD